MKLLVVPFTTAQLDPDALALAHYCTVETAAALGAALLADEVELTAPALQAAAAAVKADAALGATVQLSEGQLELEVLSSHGLSLHQSLPLGAVPQVGLLLAQAALGEEAAPPVESFEAGLVLRLARAVRGEDLEELLALCREPWDAARRSFLSTVRAGQGGPRWPALHAALERFVEEHPDDAAALILLGSSRAEHLDEAGARELFLRARKAAPGAELQAQALSGLFALAFEAGRKQEAVAHLRAAVKLVDDALLYGALGGLLLDDAPEEAIAALTKAAILAPKDPWAQLTLATALREHGGDLQRALAAATAALRLSNSDAVAAAARKELELILG